MLCHLWAVQLRQGINSGNTRLLLEGLLVLALIIVVANFIAVARLHLGCSQRLLVVFEFEILARVLVVLVLASGQSATLAYGLLL